MRQPPSADVSRQGWAPGFSLTGQSDAPPVVSCGVCQWHAPHEAKSYIWGRGVVPQTPCDGGHGRGKRG
ncbi:unnamed protein product, partial [Amoebophrya sp. A120]|eukprot:GSA120T00016787001.1